MGWNDTKEYNVFLTERDIEHLKELKGFLHGLEAAGKKVPGRWTFDKVEENLKEVEKSA